MLADELRRLSFALLCFSLVLFSPPAQADEESAQVYFFHGLKSKEEGRLLTAERLLRKAIEIEPGNPDYHFELGNLYILRNKPLSARLEFEQAVMIAPDHLPSHYNLGLVYRELDLASEARDQFRRVLEIDPNHLKAELQIGYTYAQEGFVEEAREAFRKAKQMDPTSPEPEEALRNLEHWEEEARRKSQADLGRKFLQSQQSLNQPDAFVRREGDFTQSSQLSGQSALAQAGALLAQEFFARRAQAEDE